MFDGSSRSMRQMQQMIPEIVEDFELSREHLDVLRNGNFANINREVEASQSLHINYGRGAIPHSKWGAIEWITDEERNALTFLFTSEELNRNFEWIYSGVRNGALTAVLFEQGGPPNFQRIEIWYGEEGWLFPRSDMDLSESVYLGDGYTLWIYTVRGPASIPFL